MRAAHCKRIGRFCCSHGCRCGRSAVFVKFPAAGRQQVRCGTEKIIADAEAPFIVKGIMTPQAALKAKEAGAAAIVVSNHGGRVLDQCPPQRRFWAKSAMRSQAR